MVIDNFQLWKREQSKLWHFTNEQQQQTETRFVKDSWLFLSEEETNTRY